MADLQRSEHAGELGHEHGDELPAQTPAPFPDQFKETVWSSPDEAKKDLKAWAQGQAFQLRIVQSYRYRSGLKEGKLYQVFLECHRAKQTGGTSKLDEVEKRRNTRTKDCQCPMRVGIELKWDGRKQAGEQAWWALKRDKCNWEHNHCLHEADKMFNRQLPKGPLHRVHSHWIVGKDKGASSSVVGNTPLEEVPDAQLDQVPDIASDHDVPVEGVDDPEPQSPSISSPGRSSEGEPPTKDMKMEYATRVWRMMLDPEVPAEFCRELEAAMAHTDWSAASKETSPWVIVNVPRLVDSRRTRNPTGTHTEGSKRTPLPGMLASGNKKSRKVGGTRD